MCFFVFCLSVSCPRKPLHQTNTVRVSTVPQNKSLTLHPPGNVVFQLHTSGEALRLSASSRSQQIFQRNHMPGNCAHTSLLRNAFWVTLYKTALAQLPWRSLAHLSGYCFCLLYLNSLTCRGQQFVRMFSDPL